MLVRVQLPEPCLLSSMAEHVLGTDEAAGSVPAGGFMRMWRNGNASPCRGEDPGPIPGIRSRGALDQLAGVTALRPQECGFESRGRYSRPDDRMARYRPATPSMRVRVPLGHRWIVKLPRSSPR